MSRLTRAGRSILILAPLLASALLTPPALAQQPSRAMLVGWYETDLHDAVVRQDHHLQLFVRETFFDKSPVDQDSIVRGVVELWGPADDVYVEVRGAERGRLVRYSVEGRRMLPLSEWDLRARPTGRVTSTGDSFRKPNSWFISLNGQMRLSETTRTFSLGGRVGTFLYRGKWDVSLGFDNGLKSTSFSFPSTTGGAAATDSDPLGFTNITAQGRRHFKVNEILSVNVGAQFTVAAIAGNSDLFPQGVAGVAVRPGQSFSIIDLTITIGNNRSASAGLTWTAIVF